MPYTTKITVETKGERTALRYDISQSGITMERPEELNFAINTEVFLTTRLEGKLKNFDIQFELSREPGRIVRFFERDGKGFVGITFPTPKLYLSGLVQRTQIHSHQFKALMLNKRQKYEQELITRVKIKKGLE